MQKTMEIFARCAGALLLAAATALVLSNLSRHLPDQIPPRDPVLQWPVTALFWLAAGIAGVTGLYCLFAGNLTWRMLGLAWAATLFASFRAGLLWSGARTLDGYLGALAYAFGVSPHASGLLADVLLGCGWLVSVSCAIWLGWARPAYAGDYLKMFCAACGGPIRFPAAHLHQGHCCPHCQAAIVFRSPEENLKMSCYFCKGHIEFPAHALGQKVRCPHCRARLGLKESA